MKRSGTRLRPGDVLELRCDDRFALLSYLGKHHWLGDALFVLPKLFDAVPEDYSAEFRNRGYTQFYPATAAARDGELRRVGYCTEAIRLLPSKVRTIANREASGRVARWIITDARDYQEPRDTLSAEERALPVGVIVNTAKLRERLAQGWEPGDYDREG